MKTKIYNKLVRDKIPEIIESKGDSCIVGTLSENEYIKMLDEKLFEELCEYRAFHEIEELADLLEVVYASCDVLGYSRDELEKVRAKKAELRGGFEKRILLKEVHEKD